MELRAGNERSVNVWESYLIFVGRMTDSPLPSAPARPFARLRAMLLLVGFVLVGMNVGAVLALLLVAVGATLTGNPDLALTTLLREPAQFPGGWWWLMGVQALSHLSTYLAPALLFWHYIERKPLHTLNRVPTGAVAGWSLVVLLTLTFIPVNGLIIEWNQALRLPAALAPLEQWMRHKEDELAVLTRFLTTFGTVPALFMAVFTIGVVAAVGEEVLFRGILQRKFTAWTGNVHAGIWLAAALFSAIHLQFYGFFPRMLLGALFGYLLVWSGNLWVPMVAHFVNNGFTVLMLFLYQRKLTTLDIESTDAVPVPAVVAGTLLTAALLVDRKSVV